MSARVFGDTVLYVDVDDEQTTVFLYGATDWPSFHLDKDQATMLGMQIDLCADAVSRGAAFDWTSPYAELHGDTALGVIHLVDPTAPAGGPAVLSFDVIQATNLRPIWARAIGIVTTHVGEMSHH